MWFCDVICLRLQTGIIHLTKHVLSSKRNDVNYTLITKSFQDPRSGGSPEILFKRFYDVNCPSQKKFMTQFIMDFALKLIRCCTPVHHTCKPSSSESPYIPLIKLSVHFTC